MLIVVRGRPLFTPRSLPGRGMGRGQGSATCRSVPTVSVMKLGLSSFSFAYIVPVMAYEKAMAKLVANIKRRERMWMLYHERKWSLAKIGREYGISRQRVWQILRA